MGKSAPRASAPTPQRRSGVLLIVWLVVGALQSACDASTEGATPSTLKYLPSLPNALGRGPLVDAVLQKYAAVDLGPGPSIPWRAIGDASGGCTQDRSLHAFLYYLSTLDRIEAESGVFDPFLKDAHERLLQVLMRESRAAIEEDARKVLRGDALETFRHYGFESHREGGAALVRLLRVYGEVYAREVDTSFEEVWLAVGVSGQRNARAVEIYQRGGLSVYQLAESADASAMQVIAAPVRESSSDLEKLLQQIQERTIEKRPGEGFPPTPEDIDPEGGARRCYWAENIAALGRTFKARGIWEPFWNPVFTAKTRSWHYYPVGVRFAAYVACRDESRMLGVSDPPCKLPAEQRSEGIADEQSRPARYRGCERGNYLIELYPSDAALHLKNVPYPYRLDAEHQRLASPSSER